MERSILRSETGGRGDWSQRSDDSGNASLIVCNASLHLLNLIQLCANDGGSCLGILLQLCNHLLALNDVVRNDRVHERDKCCGARGQGEWCPLAPLGLFDPTPKSSPVVVFPKISKMHPYQNPSLPCPYESKGKEGRGEPGK